MGIYHIPQTSLISFTAATTIQLTNSFAIYLPVFSNSSIAPPSSNQNFPFLLFQLRKLFL